MGCKAGLKIRAQDKIVTKDVGHDFRPSDCGTGCVRGYTILSIHWFPAIVGDIGIHTLEPVKSGWYDKLAIFLIFTENKPLKVP